MFARVRRFAFAGCALAGLGSAIAAQSVARFDPATSGPDRALELRFVRVESRAVRAATWPRADAGWFFVREEGAQRNLDALEPDPTEAARLRLELERPGVARLGWDPRPRVESIEPERLKAFLLDRGGRERPPAGLPALERREPVRVARLESLGLIARPAKESARSEPSAVALGKTGQRMELRPIADPGSVAAGGDFVFKLYLPEGGDANVYLRFVHLSSRTALAAERLQDGSVRGKLALAGAWMLEAHRVRALAGAGEPELELASTTLVFEVPAAAAREGGGR